MAPIPGSCETGSLETALHRYGRFGFLPGAQGREDLFRCDGQVLDPDAGGVGDGVGDGAQDRQGAALADFLGDVGPARVVLIKVLSWTFSERAA